VIGATEIMMDWAELLWLRGLMMRDQKKKDQVGGCCLLCVYHGRPKRVNGASLHSAGDEAGGLGDELVDVGN